MSSLSVLNDQTSTENVPFSCQSYLGGQSVG